MPSKRLRFDEIVDVVQRLGRVLDGSDCPGSRRCRETLLMVDAMLCRVHNYLAAREARHKLWVQAVRRKGDADGTT